MCSRIMHSFNDRLGVIPNSNISRVDDPGDRPADRPSRLSR
jgi:hypothetical protein